MNKIYWYSQFFLSLSPNSEKVCAPCSHFHTSFSRHHAVQITCKIKSEKVVAHDKFSDSH